MVRIAALVALACAGLAPAASAQEGRAAYDAMIARHASANGVPVALVHRVVMRESRYNARAVGRGGAMGLMQIKHATARGQGYAGSASGLLDAETNLTYAVRYLAGAYRVAGGNPDRAVAYYTSGYYYAAKRQGFDHRGEVATRETRIRRASSPRRTLFGSWSLRQSVAAGPRPRDETPR